MRKYLPLVTGLGLLCLCLLAPANAASYPAGGGTGTQGFDRPDGTLSLEDGTSIGSDQPPGITTPVSGIYDGTLRLTDQHATNVVGSFKLPDLDPGNVVLSFDLKFSVTMDPLNPGEPGEGWSVNFGPLPDDNGTGEGGFVPLRQGLTIAFDTRAGDGDPASIQIIIDGVVVGTFPKTFSFDAGQRPIALHWDAAGLDLSYETRAICTDWPTPGFIPNPGDRFGFTARATANSMTVALDNLRASTQALPVIETGGPIISEFVADNSQFEDEYASKPDWLELFNGSPEVVDLTGWYLTDSKSKLPQWKIKGLKLNPYNYQVVFASGRDLQASSSNLPHASFSLSRNSGYLALVKPDGRTIASAYTYGGQDPNVAYGEMGTNRLRGYMFPASPGTVNLQVPAPQSLSPSIGFSHPGGFVAEPVLVALSISNAPGAEIRFTLDRSEPTPASPLYTNPISITNFTTIKARSYSAGYLPGLVSSRTYVLLDSTMTDYSGTGRPFESNLPFLFVDSFGFSVDASSGGSRPFRPGFAVVVRPDPASGRASLSTLPEYAGPCGVHLRGESSAGFDQHSYSLELQDDLGQDRPASLLGMPADSDWLLYGPWSEKTLLRNKLIFDWMRALRGDDGSAVRSEFVELFFNQSKPASGRVGFGSYRGIYLLMEKLKRGRHRVPIENLNDKSVAADLITGGYIIRKDKDDTQKNNWLSGSMGIPLQSYDPDRLNLVQFNYLKKFTADMERALTGASFRNARTGYQAYLDPDTFIDSQWFTEIAKQVDGYVFSTYFTKDRFGRLRAGPLWDFNISLGNADYASGETPTGWLYDVPNGVGQLWFPRLHADPEYRLAYWDRYWQMRRTFLATDAVLTRINQHMTRLLDGYTGLVSNRAPAEIQNPVARHFRKWPRLGVRDWPNPAASTKIRTWQAEVEYLKTWLTNRLNWLDDQSLRSGKVALRPPVFTVVEGAAGSPARLSLTAFNAVSTNATYPGGILYYTTDNSDPRLPGGLVNPGAIQYRGPFSTVGAVTVQARLLSQNQWSPLGTVTLAAGVPAASPANLAISEICYQPGPLSVEEIAAGLSDPEQFEFVELHNQTLQPIDLTGVSLTDGIDFDFAHLPAAARLLKGGESAVLVADLRAFALRYPQVPRAKVLGQYRRHLSNGGDALALKAADGRVITQFNYQSKTPWPVIPIGSGLSLIRRDPSIGGNPDDPANWVASARSGGTPGVSGAGAARFVGEPNRDTDGDGVDDFLEFVSGSDPEDPQSARPPRPALTRLRVNGIEDLYLSYTIRRDPALPGLQLALENATELGTWQPADTSLVIYETIANLDGTVTDIYRSTAPWMTDPERTWFLRLRASQK